MSKRPIEAITMGRRRRPGVGVLVAAVLAAAGLAGCGDGESAAVRASASPGASPSAASDFARYRSDLAVARGLDQSILTVRELTAAGLEATEIPPGAGARPRPAGPLNIDGLVATLVRGDALRPALAKASGGAYHQYAIGPSSPGGTVLGIRAIRFDGLEAARSFVDALVGATSGIKATERPDQRLGALPVRILRNPVAQPSGAQLENAGSSVTYGNGVVYLLSFVGPQGSTSDDRVLEVLRAQDGKYQSLKVRLDLA
jgi:hypothetical protein